MGDDEATAMRPGLDCWVQQHGAHGDLNTSPVKWNEEARTTWRIFKRELEKIRNKYGQLKEIWINILNELFHWETIPTLHKSC